MSPHIITLSQMPCFELWSRWNSDSTRHRTQGHSPGAGALPLQYQLPPVPHRIRHQTRRFCLWSLLQQRPKGAPGEGLQKSWLPPGSASLLCQQRSLWTHSTRHRSDSRVRTPPSPSLPRCKGRKGNLLTVAYLLIRCYIDMDKCEQTELVYSIFEFLSATIIHLLVNNPGY